MLQEKKLQRFSLCLLSWAGLKDDVTSMSLLGQPCIALIFETLTCLKILHYEMHKNYGGNYHINKNLVSITLLE